MSRVFHDMSLEFDAGLMSSACWTTEPAHEIDLDNGQTDRSFCTDHPFMFFIINEQTGDGQSTKANTRLLVRLWFVFTEVNCDLLILCPH